LPRHSAECQVKGFPGAKYQKFDTRARAEDFISMNRVDQERMEIEKPCPAAVKKETCDIFFAHREGWWGAYVSSPTAQRYLHPLRLPPRPSSLSPSRNCGQSQTPRQGLQEALLKFPGSTCRVCLRSKIEHE